MSKNVIHKNDEGGGGSPRQAGNSPNHQVHGSSPCVRTRKTKDLSEMIEDPPGVSNHIAMHEKPPMGVRQHVVQAGGNRECSALSGAIAAEHCPFSPRFPIGSIRLPTVARSMAGPTNAAHSLQ